MLAAPVGASAVECVRPGGAKGCHPTIQQAVDAASPGELVEVYPGSYVEDVVVTTERVRLVGMGDLPQDVVVDADGAGVALSIQAAGVRVRNLTARNAETGVVVAAPGARVAGVRVLDCALDGVDVLTGAEGSALLGSYVSAVGGHGVSVGAANVAVRRTTVLGAPLQGILIAGEAPAVTRNRVFSGDQGIRITGNGATVSNNRIVDLTGFAVVVKGDGAEVMGNRVSWTVDSAVAVVGDDPKVVGNVVRTAESGIDISCTPCTGGLVAGNAATNVYNCPGFDLRADAPGLVVRYNRSHDSLEEGFLAVGPGMLLLGNEAVGNGWIAVARDGFYVEGDGNRLVENVAEGNGLSGFSASGADLVLRRNRAFDNRANGLDLQTLFLATADALLAGNVARGNLRYGVAVGADVTGAVLRRNVAGGNLLADFCDEGTGTVLGTGRAANSFGTVCTP